MERLAPVGPVYQAGTLCGNPLSVAAGLATLSTLRDTRGAYERLEMLGARMEGLLCDALAATRVPGCVNRVGSMLTLFIGPTQVRNRGDASTARADVFARWFRGMLAEGMYLPPSPFEACFISLAHTESDIDELGRAARHVLASVGG
jgi:glutamate-1-semialdehyde 2,1-aminomutase